MYHSPRPVFFISILLVAIGSCQIIGGLDALRLAEGSGGGGTGGAGGAAGTGGMTSSTGTNGVGGGGGSAPVGALWSKRFGDGTTQSVTDVAVDAAGNIFVVGAFLGTLDFGSGMVLTSAGDYDAFIVKLDTDGNPTWALRFGGTGPDRIESLALTSTGDPVVGGSYGGGFSIGMKNIGHVGGLDAFLMRFSGTDGSLTWENHFGDSQNQRIAGVAVTSGTQDITCFGDFSGVVDFGAAKFTSAGLEDLIIARYSSGGSFVAALQSGDAESQTARSVIANPTGAVYAAAQFDGKIDWGPAPLTSAGQGDVFLGRFNFIGTIPWTLRMGDTNTQTPNGMSLVASTGLALVGNFKGACDFGGKAISSKGNYDAFVTRVDAAGTVSWIRSIGDKDPMGVIDDQFATDVAAADDGSLFVTGYVAGTVDFGNNLVAGPGDTDFFIMRMDPTGQTVWAIRSGSDNSQYGRAIALSGTNEIVVAGDFRMTLDLGNGPLESAGSNDIFIAKLPR